MSCGVFPRASSSEVDWGSGRGPRYPTPVLPQHTVPYASIKARLAVGWTHPPMEEGSLGSSGFSMAHNAAIVDKMSFKGSSSIKTLARQGV